MSRENNRATRAVVLLSGGLDSATVLAMARAERVRVLRAFGRLRPAPCRRARGRGHDRASARCARTSGHAHRSSQTSADPRSPTRRWRCRPKAAAGIPITYVPARNTIMLSLALAWAEVLNAGEIHIGVNAVDYSGYPDCRPAVRGGVRAACAARDQGGSQRVHRCASMRHSSI
jgi:7-cyano-7-deazaguanine synthase